MPGRELLGRPAGLPPPASPRAGPQLAVGGGERRPPAVRIGRSDGLRELTPGVGAQRGQRCLPPGCSVVALSLMLDRLQQGLDLVGVVREPRFAGLGGLVLGGQLATASGMAEVW